MQGLGRVRALSHNHIDRVSKIIKDGSWDLSSLEVLSAIIEEIQRTQIHRGLDDCPIWLSTNVENLTNKVIYQDIRSRGE